MSRPAPAAGVFALLRQLRWRRPLSRGLDRRTLCFGLARTKFGGRVLVPVFVLAGPVGGRVLVPVFVLAGPVGGRDPVFVLAGPVGGRVLVPVFVLAGPVGGRVLVPVFVLAGPVGGRVLVPVFVLAGPVGGRVLVPVFVLAGPVGGRVLVPVFVWAGPVGGRVQAALAILLLACAPSYWTEFQMWSSNFAVRVSHPKIVFKARLQNGKTELIKDYLESYEFLRENRPAAACILACYEFLCENAPADARFLACYEFLRENTPADARILAWWDYGYQITSIGNRTTLADGNTWNQAHIALIGKMLTSPEKKAHNLIKHLADCILVWSGGGGDDLAKSPHLARIATSNFPKHCGDDRNCAHFGFYDDARTQPSPMMAKSLLFKLTSNNVLDGVTIDHSLWEEVFTSAYMKVRIYKVQGVDKESRAWLADPANKLCDRHGSWYCPGQYPPAIWNKLPSHFLKGHRLPENYTSKFVDS
eukprot:gene21958-29008_t